MEYELIEVGPCRKKLLLKFGEDEINQAFDESYREINGYVQLKGFRKGKAPRRTLEKRFGKEAAAGAKRLLTEKNLSDVITKADIHVIGEVADKKAELPEPSKAYTAEIELDVAPDFEIPEYKGLELEQKPVEVTDAQVEEAMERYRKMFANYQAIEEPAAADDVLNVDFLATIEGREVINMKDQRLRVEGDVLFGLPCNDLVEKFTGAKAGDTVELTITMPEDHPDPEVRGKEALITVTVNTVERGELPALDDTFASNLGMNTLAEFRDRVKANLVREAMVETRNKQEEEIINRLLGAVDYEIPSTMHTAETQALEEQYSMRLARAGVKQEDIPGRLGNYHQEASDLARKKIRWGIMAAKIGDKEGITVTNDDLAQQVEALARNYNTTPAKIIQRIREFDGVAPMMQEILSIKVVQFILDHTKGGRLDPDNPKAEEETAGADTAAEHSHSHGEGQPCDCGHDHGHSH